ECKWREFIAPANPNQDSDGNSQPPSWIPHEFDCGEIQKCQRERERGICQCDAVVPNLQWIREQKNGGCDTSDWIGQLSHHNIDQCRADTTEKGVPASARHQVVVIRICSVLAIPFV